MAAQGGHLDTVKYLHDNYCPWNSQVVDAAASQGHLEMVQYLRNARTCTLGVTRSVSGGARGGHLDWLKYLRLNWSMDEWVRGRQWSS